MRVDLRMLFSVKGSDAVGYHRERTRGLEAHELLAETMIVKSSIITACLRLRTDRF